MFYFCTKAPQILPSSETVQENNNNNNKLFRRDIHIYLKSISFPYNIVNNNFIIQRIYIENKLYNKKKNDYYLLKLT